MNTQYPEFRIPTTGRHSDEFKRQVVAACHAPGVSKAAIALANGLNANMLRRWVVESSQGRNSQLATLHVIELTDVGTGLPCDLALGCHMQIKELAS